MPFRKWVVEPVYLGRIAVPPDKRRKTDICEYELFCNTALVKCLQQLASLTKTADRIFTEIGVECRALAERTEHLCDKIAFCRQAVDKLDARSTRVPVSDMGATFKFLRHNKPYRTFYDKSCQFFLPSNRPPCIDQLYNNACATPVSVICTIDKYHTDGCTSSQLFMVTPVLGGTARKRKKKNLDIEMRKPANFSLARSQEYDELGTSQQEDSLSRAVTPAIDDGMRALDRLPSPEELALAVSLEYPSSVVPIDVSGSSLLRMSKFRRSLMHADFTIKHRKSRHSKRRHTVCEGENKDLETAIQNIRMVNTSCQTDVQESGSLFSFRHSFLRRKSKAVDHARRETIALETLNLSSSKNSVDNELPNEEKKRDGSLKKSSKGSLISRATNFNPISSLSSALSMAVKMRHAKTGKHDDGRSSSGNWSASSSTRASVDSDQHMVANAAIDRASSVSRSSAGKDSVLSDITQQGSVRSQEHGIPVNQMLSLKQPSKLNTAQGTRTWDYEKGRESNSSTPERSSDCASTPLVMSPYVRRRYPPNCYPPTQLDDGESSVYSVDTDGYYTSMHTDSGLYRHPFTTAKADDMPYSDPLRLGHRRESQSSVSTIGNGSVNSFLSKTAAESSTNGSATMRKRAPNPPPRGSSSKPIIEPTSVGVLPSLEQLQNPFEKENTPAESDNEVGDRIRVKTTINSSRYPSMCAVSPETSDEEIAEIRANAMASVVNVIAEVHREDCQGDNCHNPSPNVASKSDMSENTSDTSPTESYFMSSLTRNSNILTSTPKQTSITSDENEESPFNIDRKDSKAVQQDHKEGKHASNISQPFVSTPPFQRNVSLQSERTLIPLKYAQCITVTPIVKGGVNENQQCQSPNLSSSPARPRNFLRNPLNNLSFRQNEASKINSSSYISFQSPDALISSSCSTLPKEKSAPTTRAIARVTLDPAGKVIYSSSSLDRYKHEKENDAPDRAQKYATLPKYQLPSSQNYPSEQNRSFEDIAITNNSLANANQSTGAKYNSKVQQVPENKNIVSNEQSSVKAQNLYFRPSRGGRFCRTYFPSHLIPNYIQQSEETSVQQSVPKDTYLTSYSTTNKIGLPDQRTGFVPSYNKPVAEPYTSRLYRSPSPAILPTSPDCRRESLDQQPFLSTSHSRIPLSNAQRTSNVSDTFHNRYPSTSVPSRYHYSPVHLQKETSVPVSVTTLKPRYNIASSVPIRSPYMQAVSTAQSTNQSTSRLSQLNSHTKLPQLPPSNPPDIIPSSSTPPSTLDITSQSSKRESKLQDTHHDSNSNQSPNDDSLKNLSSNELFAIIHSSKRKHNIKTESEKSLSPLSSRSSSPSITSPTSLKAGRIESGVLAKPPKRHLNQIEKNTRLPITPNKNYSPNKMQNYKPTSMHDFKMLLLQTRVGTSDSNTRPSAAEILKVSPSKSPEDKGSVSSTLPVQQKPSIVSNLNSIIGKRGIRTRSPYLTRYDSAYPPIWEDCSEDLEAADENQNDFNVNSQRTETDFYSDQRNTILDNDLCSRKASTWV